MTNPDEREVALAEVNRLWAVRDSMNEAMKLLNAELRVASSRWDQEHFTRMDIAKGLSEASHRFPWGDYWSLDGV